MPRLDRYGDPLDLDREEPPEARPLSRRQLTRKGRPVTGLARTVRDLGGKCDTCHRFICTCEETHA